MFDPQAENARYEENARYDRFDGWGDIDPAFEAQCDDQMVCADIDHLLEEPTYEDCGDRMIFADNPPF